MPPKPKFKREEIIEAALKIVSEGGIEALTAMELRSALDCSASPIFTVFNSMKEIVDGVRLAAIEKFDEFATPKEVDVPYFKQIGMSMVRFGIYEPKLYQLLFMQENYGEVLFDDMFTTLDSTAAKAVEAVESEYKLRHDEAMELFENIWIYTFGMGALCARGVCKFSEERLSEMLTDEFTALMLLIISKRKNA